MREEQSSYCGCLVVCLRQTSLSHEIAQVHGEISNTCPDPNKPHGCLSDLVWEGRVCLGIATSHESSPSSEMIAMMMMQAGRSPLSVHLRSVGNSGNLPTVRVRARLLAPSWAELGLQVIF